MKDINVHVVGWDKFQHYKDRRPTWIKNYVDLLRRDEYTDLTPAARAVLHGIWLLTASRPDASRVRARSLSPELRMRVTQAHLDSLNQAGFVQLSSSLIVPRAHRTATPETEEEKETERKGKEGELDGPLADTVRYLFDPIVRKRDGTSPYTGCRATRGAGAVGYEYDPLGTERPPKGWPHPAPSTAEIRDALEQSRRAAGE